MRKSSRSGAWAAGRRSCKITSCRCKANTSVGSADFPVLINRVAPRVPKAGALGGSGGEMTTVHHRPPPSAASASSVRLRRPHPLPTRAGRFTCSRIIRYGGRGPATALPRAYRRPLNDRVACRDKLNELVAGAMNVLRTIQASEDPRWIAGLYTNTRNPVRGVTRFDPPQLPIPFRMRHAQLDYLYIVYRGAIVAYGAIDKIVNRSNVMMVGTALQPVQPGQTIVIAGVYQHMPPPLRAVRVRGFTSVRYTGADLHTLNPSSLRNELIKAGVLVY